MQSTISNRLGVMLCAALAAAAPATPAVGMLEGLGCGTTADSAAALIIGHRGAPEYLPENTLAGHELAIGLGADYIETDLVSTRDGELIARHEPNLLHTTDITSHPEFAHRRRVLVIDGVPEEGFFASDFTLAEIRTLVAVQPGIRPAPSSAEPPRIPTLDEILQLVRRHDGIAGRRIGLYVEAKHAGWHRAQGLPLEEKLLAALRAAGYGDAGAAVFIESFEPSSLKYLRARSSLRLVQLIDGGPPDARGNPRLLPPRDKPSDFAAAGDTRTWADLLTPAGLRGIATYAAGIGVAKSWLLPARCPIWNSHCDDAQRRLLPPTRVMADARAAGLLVHPFTFRSDPHRLAQDYRGDPAREYRAFYELGVDGVITDNPDAALRARSACIIASR